MGMGMTTMTMMVTTTTLWLHDRKVLVMEKKVVMLLMLIEGSKLLAFRSITNYLKVDIQSLKISKRQPISSSCESTENRIMPIKRLDRRGSLAIRTILLLVNHFPINFNPNQYLNLICI
ncbi:unnamed protein product [Fraxinus pennsylvanica]|uniref:Uncharacterized protein n=1 Tax=Fraxinus pennsylvanica TaxID=56036 RepID=A0AAD2EBC4_9LAMI|nr:unnamed protein product [Fraxinus pennsylvanica]